MNIFKQKSHLMKKVDKNKLILPDYVENVFAAIFLLTDEVYLVGGAIRNIILGLNVKDYDLACIEEPQALTTYLKHKGFHVAPTGEKYGTISVIIDKQAVEITTFRNDLSYEGHRFPVCQYAKTIEEDLARRDFTINALAYHPHKGIVDLFCGQDDIKHKLIRAVGVPGERFREDALRMMRAIRFAAQLDFEIEQATMQAIQSCAIDIQQISKERVQQELTKILSSLAPQRAIMLLIESGLASHIDPNVFANKHCEDSARFLISNFSMIGNISLLFSACVSADVVNFLRIYHYSNSDRHNIKKFLEGFSLIKEYNAIKLKRTLSSIDKGLHKIFIQTLDHYCKMQRVDKKLYETICKDYQEIISSKQVISIEDLDIDGYDLMQLGLAGKYIREAKEYLYEEILLHPEWNEKSQLIKIIEKSKLLK